MLAPRLTRSSTRALKQAVWKGADSVGASWTRLMRAVDTRVAEVKQRGPDVVPSIDFAAVEGGSVSAAAVAEVRARGVCVVRDVVPADEAVDCYERAKEYVESNGYAEQAVADGGRAVSTFFAGGVPQIYGVYWSAAQVHVRQHPRMLKAQSWLSRLWSHRRAGGDWAFDPDKPIVYADRVRIRTPGDVSGLVAHVDGGSVERWADPGYQRYYGSVFRGDWESHDCWDGAKRADCVEWPAPNVCTVFRLFQGFTAISRQGPGDGTLQLVPYLNESIAYLLLRPLLADADAGDDLLAAAFEGKQHQLAAEWHAPLLESLVTIPEVGPGDTVWWHPDVIHAVERVHGGTGDSAVVYVPAAPACAKNAEYVAKQLPAFLDGRAGPDFPQEDRELTYSGRASASSLTRLGKCQMGLEPWDLPADPRGAELISRCNAIVASPRPE
eukprot:TRINITY_DN10909_c0_g1_i1.p1 TRINITY_DN10909_c0_g1~~TRINITY_DN10909_c0_g1_i1.p1  ORF type:complete len:440 (+),score=103.09 TRINITY_DN10909_c0_g1_i1:61-1380(+)